MIKLENLNKFYNKGKKNQIHVINNTSLELPDKGLIALLGNSGCGKTTLLNVIGGLDKTNKGNIYIEGKRITRKSSYTIDKIRNMTIGYIFQDYKLVDSMTVYDNVSLVLKMLGIKDKSEIDKRVNYILERVGMYRYRYRPCGMLSGGERQRVGIARALVKNPNIILADEPTGNLDSKNTIEIMNIIKSISKDKLVILVTHEVNLAKFYATRIIELSDGTVIKDYDNTNQDNLDYKVENKIYLKDFKNIKTIKEDNINLNIYSDLEEKLNLNIVFKNGNIYIENKDKYNLEVIDNSSNIELINDNYKKIDKSIYEKYSFDFDKIINKDTKLKYSSIFNIFSLIKYGFKKVFGYSIIKKILLVGFFLSSMFITFAISNVFGLNKIDDKNFVVTNKDYLLIESNKIKYNDYLEIKNLSSANYVLPGNSQISFSINLTDFIQTSGINILTGSLSSTEMITESDLIYGSLPVNDNEIVLDELVLTNSSQDMSYYTRMSLKMAGVTNVSDLVGKEIYFSTVLGEDNIYKRYTITGIVSKESPSIYVFNSELMDILISNKESTLYDYNEYIDKIKLTKGEYPNNEYEVIVNENLKDVFKLNKYINDLKVNNEKLKVVGYYSSKENINLYLVSRKTIEIDLITNTSDMIIYPKDRDTTINEIKELGKYAKDVYLYDKEMYIDSIKDSIISNLIVAFILLAISLVEIILMVRSSFLSRIKEVGIYRAIGVKKSDIYKMFSSESFAISTLASLPGIAFMSFCLYKLSGLPYIGTNYLINPFVIILCILIIYIFNILVGLIPVINTIRKTPARILSGKEVD